MSAEIAWGRVRAVARRTSVGGEQTGGGINAKPCPLARGKAGGLHRAAVAASPEVNGGRDRALCPRSRRRPRGGLGPRAGAPPRPVCAGGRVRGAPPQGHQGARGGTGFARPSPPPSGLRCARSPPPPGREARAPPAAASPARGTKAPSPCPLPGPAVHAPAARGDFGDPLLRRSPGRGAQRPGPAPFLPPAPPRGTEAGRQVLAGHEGPGAVPAAGGPGAPVSAGPAGIGALGAPRDWGAGPYSGTEAPLRSGGGGGRGKGAEGAGVPGAALPGCELEGWALEEDALEGVRVGVRGGEGEAQEGGAGGTHSPALPGPRPLPAAAGASPRGGVGASEPPQAVRLRPRGCPRVSGAGLTCAGRLVRVSASGPQGPSPALMALAGGAWGCQCPRGAGSGLTQVPGSRGPG